MIQCCLRPMLALLAVGSSFDVARAAAASPAQASAPPPALSYSELANGQNGAKLEPAAVAAARRQSRPHRRHAKPHSQARRSILREVEARSTEAPRAPEFVNAALHYTYEPGKLYAVETAMGYLTAIALRPGERILAKAAGDTTHWEVGETSQGSGAGAQALLLIKPLDAGVRTNMILTTDQRTYVLDLVSAAGSDHVTLVDWRYPADEMRELQLQRAALTVQTLASQSTRTPASPLISPPAPLSTAGAQRLPGPQGAARSAAPLSTTPSALDFNYKITPQGRRAPSWTPEHVFDDGRKTYVKFPADIATKEIPPIFVIGPGGDPQLVNYRFETGYYVIDHLFSTAELRLGTNDQEIVRIAYKGPAR